MNKCPRCNLPQNGFYKCQYCGYVLTKYIKKQSIFYELIYRNLKYDEKDKGFEQGIKK